MAWSRYIRISLAVAVLAAFSALVVTVLKNRPSSAPPEQVVQQIPPNVDVALRKAKFTEVREGKTVWELVAERAEYDKEGETVLLSGIIMEFSDAGSSGKIILKARSGKYFTTSRNVSLRGDVTVRTGTGALFRSQTVEYRADQSLLVSRDSVVFEHQRLTLTALGMEMDVRRQMARFGKKIDAKVKGL